ncbi:MAG TPA: MraY family glycosyltransferase [Terriglobia bacterium]|nr:MraY family glycosyltransferase [Terriglobia bacterium]
MLGGVLTFAVAFAASWGLTFPIRQMALHWGMVDLPSPRKIHRTPIPLLGGVAIYCGTVISIAGFVESPARGQIFGILAASTLLLVVGIFDDRHLLHHQVKLFVAIPLAALTLVALGVRTHLATVFLPGPVGPILDIGLTLFWIVGITAAYNIFDHMDGLASGVTAIASLFFTILAVREGQVLVATLGAALLGGSLGFLIWNFNPAKIFMGDGGAMFLGFMVATLGLKLRLADVPEATSCMVPVLLLIVPIFDTTLVSISRARRGLIPFASPGKDHAAHRLANAGLGQRGAVLALYAVGAASGLLALLVCRLSVELAYVLAFVVASAALAAVAMLERFPYERQNVPGNVP